MNIDERRLTLAAERERAITCEIARMQLAALEFIIKNPQYEERVQRIFRTLAEFNTLDANLAAVDELITKIIAKPLKGN